jgi:hypothetical protein
MKRFSMLEVRVEGTKKAPAVKRELFIHKNKYYCILWLAAVGQQRPLVYTTFIPVTENDLGTE